MKNVENNLQEEKSDSVRDILTRNNRSEASILLFQNFFSHHNLHWTVDIVRGNDVICEVSLDRHTSSLKKTLNQIC